MARADFAHSYRIRVRWSEVDPQAVVFNERYLDYADVAVTEYWRAVQQAGLWKDNPIECHVAKAVVEFRKPIRADEEIDVMARTARLGNSSMTTIVEIHGTGAEDMRAAIELVAVHIDLSDHRPRTLPEAVRTALAAFDARAGTPV